METETFVEVSRILFNEITQRLCFLCSPLHYSFYLQRFKISVTLG